LRYCNLPAPTFSERSEFGARLRARRQFAPAIYLLTRRLSLTTAPQVSASQSEGAGRPMPGSDV